LGRGGGTAVSAEVNAVGDLRSTPITEPVHKASLPLIIGSIALLAYRSTTLNTQFRRPRLRVSWVPVLANGLCAVPHTDEMRFLAGKFTGLDAKFIRFRVTFWARKLAQLCTEGNQRLP
jgi:hypothetical protein